jgi:exodeoxyribonuclease VII large subunit
MDQITYNSFGYKFHTTLFQAAMQGDKTEKSIIQCLEQIHEQEKYFDAVVIIRGGGAQSDLHAFNKYWLAFHVAQFPLPVITGIGHERDETVIDMVAHTRLKTPTAVADFLIGKMLQFHEYLDNSQHKVLNFAKAFLDDENFMLSNLTHQLKESTFRSLSADKYDLNLKAKKLSIHTKNLLKSAHIRLDYNISHVDSQFKKLLESKHQDLNIIPDKLKKTQKQFLQQQMQKMVLLSNTAKYLDPQTILKRGFSITEKDGKLVRSSDNLNEHDKVVTHLHDGFFTSTVNKIQSK